MMARNILDLSSAEKRKFLDSFDYVFSDIDGVVWNLTHSIAGSADGFNELRQAGKHLTFITNNSVRSEMECVQKLRQLKIDVELDNILHPAKSILKYLNSIQFEGLIYAIASEEFKKVLIKGGYKLVEEPNIIINESFSEALELVMQPQPVKAVIIDYDFNLSFLKMMKAYYYLQQTDCLLLGGATDVYLPLTNDVTVLGPGPFLKLLEQVSHREMLTFGKPGNALAKVMMQQFHIPSPDRVLMVGDMLTQDVCFATSCGFQSLLVLSGGSSYDDVKAQTDARFIPDFYANSMADFVQFMRDL